MASESAMANYKILLYVQDDGGWVAEIPAIGGCCALMDTREEALKELEKVFRMIQGNTRKAGNRCRQTGRNSSCMPSATARQLQTVAVGSGSTARRAEVFRA